MTRQPPCDRSSYADGIVEPTLESALAPLPEGYRGLLDSFLGAIDPDERIRAAWLSGSVARGVADAGSDLDLIVAVEDDALERFSDDLRGWLAGWADAIIARELPGMPGSFYARRETACGWTLSPSP